jgi:non-specific serine/threonine protein kinase
MVYPFILRRTKEQVAPELPPRTERIIYGEMEPAQRKLYIRTREAYRKSLLGLIEGQGMDNARMKILEGLLRLRQICIHPRLVDKTYRGESAKFELLLETIENLLAERHKALIFSQFVETLKLLRAELDQRNVRYTYLDGHTNDRQGQVDIFQNDPDYPLFLISLKAGGLGLNLTAADYVIHLDPWWNPAVEMQASDRAHRIGQDKPVFVYKYILRDSVEEKILQLQERKRNLVEQLITTEASFFKTITTEDVKVLFS